FSDPGPDSPWAVDVNWGDGSTDTSFNVTQTGALGSQAHTYADSGAYTVTVNVTDKDKGLGSNTFKVTVANLPPAASLSVPTTGARGQTRTFTLSAADPSPVDQA